MKTLSQEQYAALFATNGKVTEPVPLLVEETQDFEGYKRKFIKEDWQTVDIFHLLRQTTHGTANFSEMGCYKTSTGLWYVDRKLREAGVTKPSILIISSKSGKGTFLEAIPEILPEYTILSVDTQALSL